jgi:hypothetical protein
MNIHTELRASVLCLARTSSFFAFSIITRCKTLFWSPVSYVAVRA